MSKVTRNGYIYLNPPDRVIKAKNIDDLEKAIKDIQGILVTDMSIPIESAKKINKKLIIIQNRLNNKKED
jgi:hypothetical protein